jgi:ElaB/YqjD/DUF883 family membrane-anchored ribosome-binding protein
MSQDVRGKASDAVSKLGEMAQQAGSQAKEAASSFASEAQEKTKGYLNQQVSAGADLAGQFAQSVKTAADELETASPQLAGLVRSAAERVATFSDDMRGQSVDDLMRTASAFTRRQPALVFGLASLAGFFLFRVLKSKPNGSSSEFQSASPGTTSQNETSHRASRGAAAGQYHG